MASLEDLHVADYIVFALTLIVSLGIGLYYGFKRNQDKTAEDFLLGGKDLHAVPVAISMFMSYVSGVLVLGNTAEMYTAGIQYWLACIGSSLAFLFAAWVFVPLFYPLQFTSGNEYYEVRFGSKAVRVWSAIMFILSSIIYMGLAMFTPATALYAATKFPIWGSIIAMGVITTIYTTLGGMRAVVWTDTVQGGILFAGIIAVLIAGAVAIGGLDKVWQISAEGGRLKMFDFNPDPTVRLTFWSVIFGRFFISMNYVAGQVAILRYSTLRSLKDARLSPLLNIPAIILVYTFTCLSGLTVYAYYASKGCDPIRNNEIKSSNQLLPHFIMERLNYPGLPGIFFAILFSGALSSVSSSLNAMAACTWKDLLEWRFKHVEERTKALINKFLVILYGGLAIVMAFIADTLGGHVLQATQSLVGGFGGPGLGLFFLGSFFPWANWQGALFGSLIGFGMTAWVSVGAYATKAGGFDMLPTSIANCTVQNHTDILTTVSWAVTTDDLQTTEVPPGVNSDVLSIYKLSYMYTAAWGCIITIISGIVISLITGPTHPSEVEPTLLVPVVNRFCCCLPKKTRRKGYCGIAFEKEEEDTEEMEGKFVKTAYVDYGGIGEKLHSEAGSQSGEDHGQVNKGYINSTEL